MVSKSRTQLTRTVRKRRTSPPKFLHILVDVEPHRISISRHTAVVAKQPPFRACRSPKMNGRNWQGFQMGSGEIVLAFYTVRGRLIDAVSEPTVPHYFMDVPVRGKKQVRLQGGLITPRTDQRLFHVTVPQNAAFIGLFRTEVGKPTRGRLPGVIRIRGSIGTDRAEFRIIPSSVYALPWSTGVQRLPGFEEFEQLRYRRLPVGLQPPIPIPPDFNVGVDFILALKMMRALNLWLTEDRFEALAEPPTTLNPSTQPIDQSFNIVILGDGFSTGDKLLFQTAAQLFSNALLAEEPFTTYKEVINIQMIPKWHMFQSGVTGCPEGNVKDSYYEVHGEFVPMQGTTTNERYFGMDDAARAYEVASHYVPFDEISLIFMIVNCEIPGGSAPPNNMKMAYTSLGKLRNIDPATWTTSTITATVEARKYFLETAVHEAAHVLGGLADEYITCAPWDDIYDVPANCVRRDQLNANLDDPPWLDLIQQETQDLNLSQFNPIDMPDGLTCCDQLGKFFCLHNSKVLTSEAHKDTFPRLGVYWGCMYRTRDPNLTTMENIKECFPNFPDMDCASSCCKLELAKDFFRARAWCKMFANGYPFCPVCSRELATRIQERTGFVPG